MGMDAKVIVDQKLATCWLYGIATCSHQKLITNVYVAEL